MQKHVHFWIGFFVAFLISLPVAVGVWAAQKGLARDLAAAAFGVTAFLVILLVVMLLFRDRILQRLIGTPRSAIEDVTKSGFEAISATLAGDRTQATHHASQAVAGGLAWYGWSSFYRWVIGTCIAFLVAFAGFTGTVLLFEQNEKLGKQIELLGDQNEKLGSQTELLAGQNERLDTQNALSSLSLVSRLREELRSGSEEARIGVEYYDLVLGDPIWQDGDCSLHFDLGTELIRMPNESRIGAIVDLTHSELLSESITSALTILLDDSHAGVVMGAAAALLQIGKFPDGTDLILDNAIIRGFEPPAYQSISARGSLFDISCEECSVELIDSTALLTPGQTVERSNGSFLTNSPFPVPPRYLGKQIEVSDPDFSLVSGFGFDFPSNPWLQFTLLGGKMQSIKRRVHVSHDQMCDIASQIADGNPTLSFYRPTQTQIDVRDGPLPPPPALTDIE
ncbi:hypothetical protein [Oricola sp.]|uniref:hypothetical protein n=1 Tax=Oricola sp. TaxID=1979950 RepID=UPI0025D138C4|nr:hypothetical protein [Oricola sp.]MCI5075559.1 hypothetical protein [Oricola sp.]